MEQRGITQNTGEWFLIASHGDMVARIRPGMQVGETPAGEISFDPSCAQLELDIDYDGSIVLIAVDNFELESAGGTRSRRECLARYRRAEIRLPHNVVQLDTDFAHPGQADDTLEIRMVRLTESVAKSEAAAQEVAPHPAARPDEVPPPEPKQRMARPGPGRASPQLRKPKADETPVDKAAIRPGFQTRHAAQAGVRRLRSLNPLIVGSIGLAVVGLALLYPMLREGGETQSPATVDAVPAPQTDPVPAPDAATEVGTESSAPDSEVELTTIRVPPLPLRLLELPAPEATEAVQLAAERPSEPLPERERTIAPPIEPVVLPPVEHRSMPPAVEVVDNQPNPVFVAGLEGIGEAAQAMVETLAQRRDLLAADLALTQGRLTSPPEASAYTLYNRVLAQDPASSEARSGLQSVRQQLINRALAQLAGGRLDEARSSLQAAEDAGAAPRLVADLHAEIDYRQGLTNARNQ